MKNKLLFTFYTTSSLLHASQTELTLADTRLEIYNSEWTIQDILSLRKVNKEFNLQLEQQYEIAQEFASIDQIDPNFSLPEDPTNTEIINFLWQLGKFYTAVFANNGFSYGSSSKAHPAIAQYTQKTYYGNNNIYSINTKKLFLSFSNKYHFLINTIALKEYALCKNHLSPKTFIEHAQTKFRYSQTDKIFLQYFQTMFDRVYVFTIKNSPSLRVKAQNGGKTLATESFPKNRFFTTNSYLIQNRLISLSLIAADPFSYTGTSLHYAVLIGSSELTKKLISQGLDVNVFDIFGETPLTLAIKSENYDILSILIQAEAN